MNNSINIAIHLAALENFKLEPDEKAIIIKFIKKKLLKKNTLINEIARKKYNL